MCERLQGVRPATAVVNAKDGCRSKNLVYVCKDFRNVRGQEGMAIRGKNGGMNRTYFVFLALFAAINQQDRSGNQEHNERESTKKLIGEWNLHKINI